ncbi:MAG: hypothetical protein WC759_04825 [Candidatus Micrarchaeia archaeon]|jgi:hypothetical protein
MNVIEHALKSYSRHFGIMVFFSVPALLALLIPLLSPMPTYTAVGGTFLRTGSMPELTSFDIALMSVSSLVSLFLISFAITAISIVVKSERTLTHIRKQVILALEKYTLNIFWIFLTAQLLFLIVALLAYEWQVQSWLSPLATLLASLFLIYVPAALVIDDMRPFRALQASYNHVLKNPMAFLTWIAVAVVSLSVVELVMLALLPHAIAQFAVLIINSLIIFPFLVVLQAHCYMAKYPLAR